MSKKAEKLHFFGYSLQAKGYHLIDENMPKVIIHRDIIFNESDFQRISTTVKVNEGVTVIDHEKCTVTEEEEEPVEESEHPEFEEQEDQEEDQQ